MSIINQTNLNKDEYNKQNVLNGVWINIFTTNGITILSSVKDGVHYKGIARKRKIQKEYGVGFMTIFGAQMLICKGKNYDKKCKICALLKAGVQAW